LVAAILFIDQSLIGYDNNASWAIERLLLRHVLDIVQDLSFQIDLCFLVYSAAAWAYICTGPTWVLEKIERPAHGEAAA